MTAPDVAAIARGLTKAQREAVLWCNADGSPRDLVQGSPREVSFYALAKVIKGEPTKEVATMFSLTARGENPSVKRGIWPVSTWRLTPLGLAVRAHILGGEG